MKRISTFFLIFLCINIAFAQTKQKEVDNDHLKQVFITYSQPVNGYKVSVACTINKNHIDDPNTIWGEGELIFKNEKHELIVKNPSFSDENLYHYKRPLQNMAKIETDYTDYKMDDDGTWGGNRSPFFFFDIDFDGNKELIVCLWGSMGYREHHAYQAYKINMPEGRHILSPMQQEPFNELDDYTVIDSINKKIIIPVGVDLKMGGSKIYGLSGSEIVLEEIEEYKWRHTDGIKYIWCAPTIYYYKMVNGEKTLVKIDRCPNDTLNE